MGVCMSDRMTPIPFAELLRHIVSEYVSEKTIFGIRKFYKADSRKTLAVFGEKLEMPFGPAAGPHTQLAQNIVAAYLCGSRFFELKTVQKLDGEELKVSKPCILAGDEGYNCEWSTELTVPQAYAEYVKGWFCLKILAKELALGSPDGFVFNMSVGYDLAGIKLPKIDTYIEGMKQAENTAIFKECQQAALAAVKEGILHHVTAADIHAIQGTVSRSITISTLHGCPPSEIESMAMYLLTQKKLNTFVKCNPTLLGYDYARKVLDGLGFDYIAFDDHHFVQDLQYKDAVPMLARLQKTADGLRLAFGVKLTNTFPVDVKGGELPSQEMYMSGRSLAPLTLSVARNLSRDFNGKLRISYSGGADYSNIDAIYRAGIWPVTMATTMLKPGGYQRMIQIAQKLRNCEFMPFDGVDVAAASALADKACSPVSGSIKPLKPLPVYKSQKALPLFDCFTAPCKDTCPIHQDVPAYLHLAGQGKYREALEVITDKNPLPFITGTICAHTCMGRCTRNFYDTSVAIRSEKLKAAEKAYEPVLASLKAGKSAAQTAAKAAGNQAGSKRVAVIGGGPAGISAAYLLAREGVQVTVFEKQRTCGGIVRQVIPSFRISDEAIEKDIGLAKAAGAEFVTGKEVTDVSSLFTDGFTDVLVAVGAWKPAVLTLEGAAACDALEFLEACKRNDPDLLAKYGRHIVVVGGGNTAMDTARAARRIQGVEQVSLVYRRTKRYMPADEEELKLALEDGVEFKELRAPLSFADGQLTCDIMQLGAPDATGRRSPEKTGRTETVPCSCIIAATGEGLPSDFYKANGIQTDAKGRPVLSASMETSVPHVYAAGDGASGPATVVQAIAGATAFASAVLELHNRNYESLNTDKDAEAPLLKKGILDFESADNRAEGKRCLECRTVCENCVDVCPNRANAAVDVPDGNGGSAVQIIHIDGMCNECGNCAVFCPYDGKPYKNKFTLFSTAADMENSTNDGFAPLDKAGMQGKKFRIRTAGKTADITAGSSSADIDASILRFVYAVIEKYPYLYY